jgi:hypothetical protein
MVIIAGLVWLAQERQEERQRGTPGGPGTPSLAEITAPPPLWEPIANPVPSYALDGPGDRAPGTLADAIDWSEGRPVTVSGPVPTYTARRHSGGGREDILVLGGPGKPVHLRLEIRRGVPEAASTSFYIDLVRRAAEAGLAVTRVAAPSPLATKFGPAEVASATFEEGQACLAFRLMPGDLAFRIGGWLCQADERPADEARLACALERLVLMPGSDDAALRVFFAQAEQRRNSACSTLRLAAAP